MATNLRLRACLTMCLNFQRFEPQVAYKTLAYKKKSVYQKHLFWRRLSSIHNKSFMSFFCTLYCLSIGLTLLDAHNSNRWAAKTPDQLLSGCSSLLISLGQVVTLVLNTYYSCVWFNISLVVFYVIGTVLHIRIQTSRGY